MTLTPASPATSLSEHYQHVRRQTRKLCDPLKPEDHVVQPIVDVSPPKWHLGHTTWFFETLILEEYLPDYAVYDRSLHFIFNSYYESQGPRILRSKRGNLTRPTVEEVLAYRDYVDEHMDRLINLEGLPQAAKDLVILGLNHEQQHQELLLTDLKYILGNNPMFPVYLEDRADQDESARPFNWLNMEEGVYKIGYEGSGFCYDNELSTHKVYLQPFELMDRLVTVGEYLEFMEAGGYDQYQWWLSEGWEWVKQLEEKAPLYWFKKEDGWYQYTLHGLRPVNPNLPVTHISYFEADAFAKWKGYRLPTEQEWEVACRQYTPTLPARANLVDLEIGHPSVCSDPKDYQFWGHAWEWTGSAYLPYPNFPKLDGALGEYNGKFMINQMVLRGGSCATPASHIRLTYRNFFHTDKQWQFTGIRLAR